MGKAHVDILRRSDPVMYILEDRSQFDRIIIGRTPDFATPTSEPCWQISCMYYDGAVITTLFANNAKYTEVWDNRGGLFSFLPPGSSLPGINITGTFETTSPIGSGKTSVVTLNNTGWTPIPAVSIPDRQGLGMQNLSGAPMLVNWSNTAPAGDGIFVANGAERYYSARSSAVIYGRLIGLASGTVTVEELAR